MGKDGLAALFLTLHVSGSAAAVVAPAAAAVAVTVQSTKIMTRTMIHHQLLPKAQIPEELLQDITKPPEI